MTDNIFQVNNTLYQLPVPVDDRIILTTSFYGFYDTEHQRLTIDYGVHVAIDGKDIY